MTAPPGQLSPDRSEAAERPPLTERIALACRILHRHGHDHLVFGHVSGRDPGDPCIHVKAACMGLEEVRPGDVVALDPSGHGPEGARLHDETPLHVEIYRARADVGGVVHTHPAAAVAMSLHPERWAVANQDAIPFWNRIAFYEQAELVASEAAGRRVAVALGGGRALLLRAHGLVTVGEDVEEATVNAVLLGRTLALLLAAGALGPVEAIPEPEVAAIYARFESRRRERVLTLWDYLVRTLEGGGICCRA